MSNIKDVSGRKMLFEVIEVGGWDSDKIEESKKNKLKADKSKLLSEVEECQGK